MATVKTLRVWLAVLSMVISAAAAPKSDEEAKVATADDALGTALKVIAGEARKQNVLRVLVVLREEGRVNTRYDAVTFAAVRKRLGEELKLQQLEPVQSTEVERVAILTRPTGVMRTDDVRILQSFSRFDALLDVVYKQRRKNRTLELTLLTDSSRWAVMFGPFRAGQFPTAEV